MQRRQGVLRLFRLVLILVTVFVGAASAGRAGSHAATQDGTPTPEGDAPLTAEGPDLRVRYEPLASGPVPALPAAPEEIVLIRLRLAPGGTFVLDPRDSGPTLYFVQAGTLTAQLSAPVRVRRVGEISPEELEAAVATGEPGAPVEEAVPANAAVTVGLDDSFVVAPQTGGELRNEGQEEVVLLAAYIGLGAAGTPTP